MRESDANQARPFGALCTVCDQHPSSLYLFSSSSFLLIIIIELLLLYLRWAIPIKARVREADRGLLVAHTTSSLATLEGPPASWSSSVTSMLFVNLSISTFPCFTILKFVLAASIVSPGGVEWIVSLSYVFQNKNYLHLVRLLSSMRLFFP